VQCPSPGSDLPVLATLSPQKRGEGKGAAVVAAASHTLGVIAQLALAS